MYQLKLINDLKIIRLLNFCSGTMNEQHSAPECHLSILHFNDVYDLQASKTEPKAGAAGFKSLMDRYRLPSTLTLFSGDVFSPALLSSEHKGQNMIKPLNSFKIDLACLGNHDLDYPIEHVKQLLNKTNFPWMLSNVHDNRTGNRLADCEQYRVIEKGGFRIGIFSLAEKQWIDTLIPEYKEFCDYTPYQQYTDYIIKQLKSQKCNLIIALTHMMKYNDVNLAHKFSEIDLILGGHDHLVVHEKINNSMLVKSGTNFKNFSLIQIFHVNNRDRLEKGEQAPYEEKYIFSNSNIAVRLTLVEVNHEKAKIEQDPQLQAYIHEIYSKFQEKQQSIACIFKQDVDLRFKKIRKEQNAYLQFLVSLYRHYTRADCAFMNSGNFRADCYIPAGPVTFGILTNIIQDEIVVKKVSGERIIMGLENCVSMYPNLSGRYSTFSGIQFTWDCSRKPFERVLANTVRINGKPVRLEKIYRVAMHGFVASGGDGFSIFKDCEIDHDHFHENNLMLVTDLLNGTEKLLAGYPQKYPGRLSYEEEDQNGHRMLVLHVPNPKNVKMVGEKVEEKQEEKKVLQKQEKARKEEKQLMEQKEKKEQNGSKEPKEQKQQTVK